MNNWFYLVVPSVFSWHRPWGVGVVGGEGRGGGCWGYTWTRLIKWRKTAWVVQTKIRVTSLVPFFPSTVPVRHPVLRQAFAKCQVLELLYAHVSPLWCLLHAFLLHLGIHSSQNLPQGGQRCEHIHPTVLWVFFVSRFSQLSDDTWQCTRSKRCFSYCSNWSIMYLHVCRTKSKGNICWSTKSACLFVIHVLHKLLEIKYCIHTIFHGSDNWTC